MSHSFLQKEFITKYTFRLFHRNYSVWSLYKSIFALILFASRFWYMFCLLFIYFIVSYFVFLFILSGPDLETAFEFGYYLMSYCFNLLFPDISQIIFNGALIYGFLVVVLLFLIVLEQALSSFIGCVSNSAITSFLWLRYIFCLVVLFLVND